MQSVNEKSPLFMTLGFTDEVGDPLVPTKVEWRLDAKTVPAEIVDWTVLPSPASTMNLTIPGSDNVIVDETHISELMAFGVRVDESLIGEAHAEFPYRIINLTGPTGP